jgi:hypothetical protein
MGLLMLAPVIVLLPKVVNAQPTFSPASTHHILTISWTFPPGGLGGGTRYPYVGGFAYTADSTPTYLGGANKTRITVSFPYTNPSVIGTQNWLAAGLFVQDQGGVDGEDYAFYSVVVLDNNGHLWLDIGEYVDHEVRVIWIWWDPLHPIIIPPDASLEFTKTWEILGVDRSTPITLTMYWDPGGSKTVYWIATINGQDYSPQGNSFNVGVVHPTIHYGFYVGMSVIDTPFWIWWCYYFQFGIMSPSAVTQGGWQAHLDEPSYFKDGSWHYLAAATSTKGSSAYFDTTWMWGGNDYPGVTIVSGWQTYGWHGYANFVYTSTTEDDWTILWPLEGGGGCVLRNTPIAMADGGAMRVQAVNPGDRIMGYDTQSGAFVTVTVTSNNQTIVNEILSINNGLLYVTPTDQPIYTDHGWVKNPQDLAIGLRIYNPTQNSWITIQSLETQNGHFLVYDLRTTEPNTFIGNGILLDTKVP